MIKPYFLLFEARISCVFLIFLSRSIKAYLCPSMINFDAVDFSERRPEEVISFFWRSVYYSLVPKYFISLCSKGISLQSIRWQQNINMPNIYYRMILSSFREKVWRDIIRPIRASSLCSHVNIDYRQKQTLLFMQIIIFPGSDVGLFWIYMLFRRLDYCHIPQNKQ